MRRSPAEIIQEYGPFPGVDQVGGVTYDGRNFWFASGDKLNAVDPHAWLADTLARIPDYKITKVDELLPWRWNG